MFTVEGAGEFPHDMLRYDQCFPNNVQDSAHMDSLARGRRQITLIHTTIGASNWHPTEERWKSFLWVVTDVQEVG